MGFGVWKKGFRVWSLGFKGLGRRGWKRVWGSAIVELHKAYSEGILLLIVPTPILDLNQIPKPETLNLNPKPKL